MGKIRKLASQKHEATLSPFISEHVKAALDAPLHRLPQCLATFPRLWPFPRGDLYHWIPVLNRFDDILQAFVSHYGLDEGPQVLPFTREYILKGSSPADATTDEALDGLGLPHDADRLLIESVLEHTILLYENCANRSLYASSAHLNHLLNTTSLSLLNLVLRLAFRLAQRYTQERVRMGGGPFLASVSNHILMQHYQLDLSKLETLTEPFVKSLHPSKTESATVKQTDKGTSVTPLFAPDLATLAQDTAEGSAKWIEYGQPWINYYAEGSASDSPPASPSPAQRSSTAAATQPATPTQPAQQSGSDTKPGLRLLEVSVEELSSDDLSAVIRAHLPSLPKSAHYEFLCRVRIAAALAKSVETRQDIVASRVMAISNLAAIYPETQLQSRVFQHEAEGTRRSQLPHQLCDLLHPPGRNASPISKPLQSTAMRALESFSNHRNKSSEVTNAIGYNVNHGVLTYLVRKATSDLSSDPSAPETPEEADWFESLFVLLHSLPKSIHRVGDAFSAAGILDSFVQALKLKTVKAEQNRHRFLTFLDVFVYNTRDAFNALVNAGGLDALSQLLENDVDTALTAAREGRGLPVNWKTPLTFSQISYVQQQTLRTLFKVLKNMIAINGGPFDRLLRNLIESPQLLKGLRTVIEHPSTYGSNVWCGAMEIFTNFIHNEPTSYAAVADGGLTKAFLDTVTLPLDKSSGRHGLLPTAESLIMVPLAFGAICLNEAGMRQFTESKALDRFFQLLLNLACGKSFATGLSDGEQLGSAFDELARHHPSLKPDIIQKLVDLASSLRDFLDGQKQHGSLTIFDTEGRSIPEIPTATAGEDVDMDDAGEPKAQGPGSQKTTTTESVHILFGLLQGVFHNHALCTPFAELGGIQALVDISATAVLHPEQVLHFCQGPVTKTMQIFIHQKPHLTIPLILDRMRKSLASLSSFLEHDNTSASFSAHVKIDNLKALDQRAASSPGTQILNDLLIVRNLAHILMRSFAEAPHRGTHPVSSVNLTDLYVELVASLGKLQSRCICEYMLLQDMAPAEDSGSKTSGSALDAHLDLKSSSSARPNQDPALPRPPEDPAEPRATSESAGDKSSSQATGPSPDKDNFKMICSVVSRIPTDVASLYSAIGKSLLLRRLNPADSYSKQCTYAIASSVANAVVGTLNYNLPESMGPKLVDYYYRSCITCTSISMVERTREAGMQPLTLTLWKFKQAGGYESLSTIGGKLLVHAQLPGYSDTDESRARGPTWAFEGLRNLTMFLGRSTSNKEITEAQQTQSLLAAFRSDRDKDKPDYFSLGQFLVEVRVQALRFIMPVWNSDSIAGMQPEFVKAVCSILQLILTADAEQGALTRQDKAPTHTQLPHRTWSPGSPESLESLSRAYSTELAEEGLFRCNNNRILASEYCELRTRHRAVPRFPVPLADLPSESERRGAAGAAVNESSRAIPLHGEPQQIAADEATAARDMISRIVEASDLLSVQGYGSSGAQEELPRRVPQESDPQISDAGGPSVVTVEDLDELRSEIRSEMVDRCLFILNRFDKLSFNLADLIVAGTTKAQDPSAMRTDISEILIQSLISYQGSGSIHEDSAKIASCAHMLGVILQDRSWFEAAQGDLQNNFDLIAQYLADVPATAPEGIAWLANVLLVLEKLLSEEAQPTQIAWIPPNPDDEGPDKGDDSKVMDLRTPLVELADKRQLFNRLVALMPRVGKDSTLGIAVVRVLVCLTRNREFAQELAERKNIQRLFLMIKQLSTVADKKFQSTVLIVMRQMVEDETIVRHVMRSEILALFEKHSVRGLDTTFYTRHLYHLVLRDPEALVEVTNDMVALSKFDRSQAPQQLVLKSSLPALEPQTASQGNAEDRATAPPSAEGNSLDKGKEPAEVQKAAEVKAPVFERHDGVTTFLLSELLAYKDVQDVAPKADGKDEKAPTGDVEMAGAEPSTAPVEAKADKSNDQKQGFKADDNPIFVYRCFLLQSLTELLQSYNCCKLNFINFSRKTEPQANTPSKPRSGILYYLLNALIPVATLSHPADDKAKMNAVVSHWATSAIVALCSKTSENREPKRRDGTTAPEDDPVLLHVRRFVLEHTLKAFKETSTADSPEAGYARLLHLADLFNRMMAAKPNSMGSRFSRPPENADEDLVPSQKQIARIMFEKNYIPALTASLADVDTNVPGATRAVKHILRPLKLLTHTAVELSLSGEASSEPDQSADEDDVSSATSHSDRADDREETPDLFRNSTLGMFEPGHDDLSDSASSADEEGDELYGDDYADDMEFDEEISAGNEDDAVSDEDEDMDGMGPVEGIDGDVPMDMEIELEEEDHDHIHDDESLSEDEDDEDQSDPSEDDDDEDEHDHDEVQIMEEISGDEENAVLVEGDEAGEWQDEEENADFDDEAADPIVVMGEGDPLAGAEDNSDYNADPLDGGDPLDMIENSAALDAYNEEIGAQHDHDEEDEPSEEDEDEEGDEEEELEDDEIVYGTLDDFDDESDMPPFSYGWPPGRRHGMHRHVHHHLPFMHADYRERLFMGGFGRAHRHPTQGRTADDDANPLLNRQRRPVDQPQHAHRHNHRTATMEVPISGPNLVARLERELLEGGMGLETALLNIVHGTHHPGLQFTMRQVPGVQDEMRYVVEPHPHRHSTNGPTRDEPSSAVSFEPGSTETRWQEAARLLFGPHYVERSQRVVNAILKLLVPPALERDRQRKKLEEEHSRKREEQRAREKAEEEREARERKEREDQEAKEAAERAAAEAETARASQPESTTDQDVTVESSEPTGEAMDVEGTPAAEESAAEPPPPPAEPRERVFTRFRGQDIDITDLGIDMDFFEAIPPEMQEEVIMQQFAERHANAAPEGGEHSGIDREFLAALPPELRADVIRQAARDRRQSQREAQQRQNRENASGAAPGGAPGNAAGSAADGAAQPEDIDLAMLASLDPLLRQQVLADTDDEILNALPSEMAAEARALGARHGRTSRMPTSYLGPEPPAYLFGGSGARGRNGGERADRESKPSGKQTRKPIVQMLDKSGVATLLRLMFVPVMGGSKSSLNTILANACGNRQTRGELVNGLLSILQDGCADANAVERCFSQLTARAKQAGALKTPQSAKKSAHSSFSKPEASPHLVLGQCLAALHFLAARIPTIPHFFLSEHEVFGGLKTRPSKKGKARDNRATKYPLVALLGLLEREFVLGNSGNMEQLSGLLAMVTRPLNDLLKKNAEQGQSKPEKDNAEASGSAEADRPSSNEQSAQDPSTPARSTGAAGASVAGEPNADATGEGAAVGKSETSEKAKEDETKKRRTLNVPEISPDTLSPIVNILMARECNRQTFQNTITTMSNLSAIPGAKDVFKHQLMQHVRDLAGSIQTSLRDLIKQLETVESDMQAQSLAMSDLDPNGSDQTKLSRIIMALDYLYDPDSKSQGDDEKNTEAAAKNSDLLRQLEDSDFVELWNLLSSALDATRRSETEYFLNVATILLPLIEALLVVCKRVSMKDRKASPSGSEMRRIFFAFTNRHKKILNDLVRQNPKLMSANFSVLVKNSGVLEFDNKRNYFNRRLHHRTGDMRQYPHPTLQLQVVRDRVFFDSYKALTFRSAQEIKYGKLNIRFEGEEGVDAGGVTREWFQVLTRQMFNANYVLFVPVASDRTTFHPNSMSWINPEHHLKYFEFIGRIIGKALYENRVLDCHFSRPVYKSILGQPVSIKDMETLDLDYSKNMEWMLNNDITDVITETFSYVQDKFGVEEIIDLVPNGRNIAVTEENKADYVRRVIEYRLTGSVKEQLDSFLKGFHDIVSPELISIFDEGELELLISGMPDIDVDDWKANTDYHNYNASSPQIQWFWRAVRSFDKEERAKLLQFVTGTGKVPLNGFKELEGMNGFTRFSIHKDFSSKDRLPSSHTCFNQLDLPEYDNYESLRKSLYTAMTTGNEYFGYA